VAARVRIGIVAALLAGAVASRAAAGEVRPYTFAVVPQGPPEKMRAVWLPIVERLSAGAGITLQIQLYAKSEDFQADLAAGKVDFAYANPVQVIRGHRAVGYRPLARDAEALRGVFFVAADSPYQDVESLARREVAFVGPWTFCSVSLRAYVHELGIVPKYVGTSANAYKNVLLGLVPAGGVLDTTLSDAPPEVRARLRVIYQTPPMAPHAVIAHPRVPREVAGRVTSALLALARTDAAGLLVRTRLSAPVEASYARDYEPLEFLLADDSSRDFSKGLVP
jgi:phosphonate transport system substrate-binding protein